jgi:hypothetical protein
VFFLKPTKRAPPVRGSAVHASLSLEVLGSPAGAPSFFKGGVLGGSGYWIRAGSSVG